MSRLNLMMAGMDVAVKMSDGNPGAISVLMMLMASDQPGVEIDPDAAFGGMTPIFNLDTLGIYGSRIWCLYKDVCEESIPHLVALLRGWQLGYVPEASIQAVGDDYRANLAIRAIVPDALAKVQERLPRFWRAPPVAATTT